MTEYTFVVAAHRVSGIPRAYNLPTIDFEAGVDLDRWMVSDINEIKETLKNQYKTNKKELVQIGEKIGATFVRRDNLEKIAMAIAEKLVENLIQEPEPEVEADVFTRDSIDKDDFTEEQKKKFLVTAMQLVRGETPDFDLGGLSEADKVKVHEYSERMVSKSIREGMAELEGKGWTESHSNWWKMLVIANRNLKDPFCVGLMNELNEMRVNVGRLSLDELNAETSDKPYVPACRIKVPQNDMPAKHLVFHFDDNTTFQQLYDALMEKKGIEIGENSIALVLKHEETNSITVPWETLKSWSSRGHLPLKVDIQLIGGGKNVRKNLHIKTSKANSTKLMIGDKAKEIDKDALTNIPQINAIEPYLSSVMGDIEKIGGQKVIEGLIDKLSFEDIETVVTTFDSSGGIPEYRLSRVAHILLGSETKKIFQAQEAMKNISDFGSMLVQYAFQNAVVNDDGFGTRKFKRLLEEAKFKRIGAMAVQNMDTDL